MLWEQVSIQGLSSHSGDEHNQPTFAENSTIHAVNL